MNTNREEHSLSTLISDLTRQTSDLIRKEAELAKAEMSKKMSETQNALSLLVIGGALLLVGLFYILDAAVYGLAEVLPPEYAPWLAALIVGVVIGFIGYIMIQTGKSKLEPRNLTPDRTMDSLHRDKNMIKERIQ